MSSKRLSAEWARAFARQAEADLNALEAYGKYPALRAAECHKMLFLQMACEKLCKSHLHARGDEVHKSHGYIASNLPRIIRQIITLHETDGLRRFKRLCDDVRKYAQEIEWLNPSMDADGARPANCEYPWQIGEKVISPLDQTFAPSDLLNGGSGRTLLKIIRLAIKQNL